MRFVWWIFWGNFNPKLLDFKRKKIWNLQDLNSMFEHVTKTSGYPWPSDTVRRKRNAPTPSLLELQRERRETTELRYPRRCQRNPRKHTGHVPVHPWQRAWFMARDPGLRGETRLHHRPGLILTPAVPHTWASPNPDQVFFYRSGLWSLGVGTLGPGLVETQDSGLSK